MIQKNNPFLLGKDILSVLEAYIKNPKVIEKVRLVPDSKGLILLMENINRVIKNGFTILEVNKEEFDSNISRKTIEKMLISNINMPFDSFSIKFNNEGKESFIFVQNNKDKVIFSRELENGILSCELKKDYNEIIETLKVYNEDSINMILDSLSVIMYFTAFKNEKNRVQISKILNKSNSTRKIAKTISIIKLNTNIYENAQDNILDSHSNKTWIVKGHWRNQWYGKEEIHKLKWIDSYWKGDSKEQMQKIYKVN